MTRALWLVFVVLISGLAWAQQPGSARPRVECGSGLACRSQSFTGNALTVNGDAGVAGNVSTGNLTVNGDAGVAGNALVKQNLLVSGDAGVAGTVDIATGSADWLRITGGAAGAGTTFTEVSSGSNSPITFTPKGTGPLIFPAATAANPGLTLAGDSTTGWYRCAANEWCFSISGVRKFRIATTRLFGDSDSSYLDLAGSIGSQLCYAGNQCITLDSANTTITASSGAIRLNSTVNGGHIVAGSWAAEYLGLGVVSTNFTGAFHATNNVGTFQSVTCSWSVAGTGGTTGVVGQVWDATSGAELCSCTLGACTTAANTPLSCSCNTAFATAKNYTVRLKSTSDCAAEPQNIICNVEMQQ